MAGAEQSDLKWEKAGTSLEIRTQGTLPNGKPALDEVVASGATVHLEQMDDHQWGWEFRQAAGTSISGSAWTMGACAFGSPTRMTKKHCGKVITGKSPCPEWLTPVEASSNVTKKLTGCALARLEADREIWQEVLDGVCEIKAGRRKRISVEPRSPIVRAGLKSGLTHAQFATRSGEDGD